MCVSFMKHNMNVCTLDIDVILFRHRGVEGGGPKSAFFLSFCFQKEKQGQGVRLFQLPVLNVIEPLLRIKLALCGCERMSVTRGNYCVFIFSQKNRYTITKLVT